eukprot:maker-scaffold_6-snap-gene-11.61-mRNA-1 protein AED:0.00 eAED:0.00 QI:99/1/1/1/1/1/2/43/290
MPAVVKRKYNFSPALTNKLLDLVGIKPPPEPPVVEDSPAKKQKVEDTRAEEVQISALDKLKDEILEKTKDAKVKKTAKELQVEAVKIKRQADKLKGKLKFVMYFRAGLRFLERIFSISSTQTFDSEALKLKELAKLFSETAQYFHACGSNLSKAVDSDSTLKEGELDHLIFVCYKLASLCYMSRFDLQKEKVGRLSQHRKRAVRNSVFESSEEVGNQLDFVYQETDAAVKAFSLKEEVQKVLNRLLDTEDEFDKEKVGLLNDLLRVEPGKRLVEEIPVLVAKLRLLVSKM